MVTKLLPAVLPGSSSLYIESRGACDDEENCSSASSATALVWPRGSSGTPSSAGRAGRLGQLVLGYLFEAGFLVLCLTSQEAEAGWAALYWLNCCAENESEWFNEEELSDQLT
eukprot:5558160-Amphidinium_carterae.1